MKRPAWFFDRDGIVNSRVMDGYVTDVDDFIFLNDFFSLFKTVKERSPDALCIIVTNQQGIGKGLMTEEDAAAIHECMQAELRKRTGWAFDDIYLAGELDASKFQGCCGEPEAVVVRRKPSPAMLLEAAERWNIDLPASWMIGDSRTDAQAGKAAGCRTILVDECSPEDAPEADYIVPSLAAALRLLHTLLPARAISS